MLKYTLRVILITGFLLHSGALSAFSVEDSVYVKGLLHLNSSVSSGEYAPEKLVKMAHEKGIAAVFLTENLMPRWEYGIYPFRRVIKKTVERDGLIKYGPSEYARRIGEINESFPDLTVNMSAEVAPFYYWTGSPLGRGGLTLHDWDIQFLVTGLEPSDYSQIPTISNGGFSGYGVVSVLKLWPFLLILLGAICLRKKHPRYYLADSLCWFFIVTGAVFALANYPYKYYRYDQYHGSAGSGPYQQVIDYVNSKGGMTFWSSPEAFTHRDLGPVWFKSPEATGYMLEVSGYTGFCCFYEGYRQVGSPGGVWDTVLGEYCAGKRRRPVWAVGEMSYHSKEASGGKQIDEVQTVFIVGENTRENIMRAMKEGSMYAVRRSSGHELQIRSFTVKYSNGETAGMGEELLASGPVEVDFFVGWEGVPQGEVTADLVRSGKVIKQFKFAQPGRISFSDDYYEPGSKIYYRLDVRGKYPSMLFSNPVFVRFEKSEAD
ncbi:MAG: hypothetical protein GF409_07225 [Candidatus Omnitrophica bacterium]|nr:hypothetical protein [Candidatus Omnitrophota bacterium]